jgi:hypothetical protein
MMTSCLAIIEFIIFTSRKSRSTERNLHKVVRLRSRLRVNGHPIHALYISLQDAVLDHVTPNCRSVIVVFSDDQVEFLFGILSVRG